MTPLTPTIPQWPGRWLGDVITSNAPLTNSNANCFQRRDRGFAKPIDIRSGLGNRRPRAGSHVFNRRVSFPRQSLAVDSAMSIFTMNDAKEIRPATVLIFFAKAQSGGIRWA